MNRERFRSLRRIVFAGIEIVGLTALTSCGSIGEQKRPQVNVLNPPTTPFTTDITGYDLEFTASDANRLEAYQAPYNKTLNLATAESWQIWRQGKNSVHVDVPEGKSKVIITALDCHPDQSAEQCESTSLEIPFVKDSKPPDVWFMGSRTENGQMIYKFKVTDVSSIPQVMLKSPDGKDVVGTFKNLGDGFMEFTIRPDTVGGRPLELDTRDEYGHEGKYKFEAQYNPTPDVVVTTPSPDGSFTIQGKLDSNLTPDFSAQGKLAEIPGLPALQTTITCGEPNIDTSAGTFTILCQPNGSHGKGEITIQTTDVNGMPVQKTLAIQFPDAPGEEVAFFYAIIGVSAIIGSLFVLKGVKRGLSWYINREFTKAFDAGTYGDLEKAGRLAKFFPGFLPHADVQFFQSHYASAMRAATNYDDATLHNPIELAENLSQFGIQPGQVDATAFLVREKSGWVKPINELVNQLRHMATPHHQPLLDVCDDLDALAREMGVTKTVEEVINSPDYKILDLFWDFMSKGESGKVFKPTTYYGWEVRNLRRLAECFIWTDSFGAADFVIAQAKGELADLSLQIRAMEKRQAKIHDPDDEVEI